VSTGGREHLALGAIARDTATVYRAHWAFLIPAAMVVLLPQVLADAFLDGLEVEGLHSLKDFATLAAIPLTIAVNLLGQAVYAGLTAAAVIDWRAGVPLPNLSALIRALPIGGLILLDLVLTIGIAIGLILLIVPGLIIATYLAISPALMKIERRGALASMRRSAELVRGNFWRVFALVVGVILVTELIVAAITAPLHGLVASTLADLAADGVIQPIEGLAIVLVAIRLLELRGEATAPRELARALMHAAE
jgi:Uncharacterised protein family (UPF0259)